MLVSKLFDLSFLTMFMMYMEKVTAFDVTIEKVSDLFLPYTYIPSERYKLDKDAAEQVVFDSSSNLLYSVGHTNVHVIDLTDVNNMTILYHISYFDVDLTDVERCGEFVFVSMDNQTDRKNGVVHVYRAYNRKTNTLELLHEIIVGSLPDMIVPTADCSRLIVAIEGEPYRASSGEFVDPPGGIGIIKFTNSPAGEYILKVLAFDSFNERFTELESEGTRFIYRGNNNTFSNDVEPEYIALNDDETKAYISLQENNAIAVLNLDTERIEQIHGLGFKDWSNYAMDPKDDGSIRMGGFPVYGMYQPDSLHFFTHNDVNYIITANEGDAKDYDGFSEEVRVEDIVVSENFEPNATERKRLKATLSRLKITTVNGKNETTGMFDKLYAFGGRGFSIWRVDTMEQVYDSGDDISHRIAQIQPHLFNNNPGEDETITDTIDKRSDDKGAETESLTTARFGHYTLVMVGNERPGVICVYSIDMRLDTIQPKFETLFSDIPNAHESLAKVYDNRSLSALDPEDIRYVPANESPSGDPLLLICGSVSGTITVYKIKINDPDSDANASATLIHSKGFLLSLLTVCLLQLHYN